MYNVMYITIIIRLLSLKSSFIVVASNKVMYLAIIYFISVFLLLNTNL